MCVAISKTPEHCNDEGFMTPFSWGYRLRATWAYPNVIAGFDLRPNLSWAHDVHGTGPVEGSAFSEGSRAISVGLDATLASTYSLSVSYTDFIDGDYGTRGDRDFISLSVGVTF